MGPSDFRFPSAFRFDRLVAATLARIDPGLLARIDPPRIGVSVAGARHRTRPAAQAQLLLLPDHRAAGESAPVCARKQSPPQSSRTTGSASADCRLDFSVEHRRAFARPGRQGCPRTSALRGLDSGLASAAALSSAADGCRVSDTRSVTARHASWVRTLRLGRWFACPILDRELRSGIIAWVSFHEQRWVASDECCGTSEMRSPAP